jgi:phospholipid transport system substrate-binding protein
MKRRHFIALSCAIAVLTGLAFPLNAAPVDLKAAARDFVAVKGNEAIQAFGMIERTQRYDRFHSLLNESFATDAIARFVVGRFWNSASEQQRARYLGQFKTYMLANYAAKAWNVKGVTLNVQQVDMTEDGDAMVDTSIYLPHKDTQNVKLGFRVRNMAEGIKIVDLQVDGVSLVMTHRADFTAKLNQLGGNLDKFCDFLAERTRGLESEADMAAQFEASRKMN